MVIFLLNREISDQYGKSETVGVFSSVELALKAASTPYNKSKRCSVFTFVLDDPTSEKVWLGPVR